MTMRRLIAASALVVCISEAAPAMADEPGPNTLPLTVIAIQTSDADDQAEALTKALRTAVTKQPGWSLGEGDYSLEVLTLSLKCDERPDLACQERMGDQIKADRFVWGILGRKDKNNVAGELNIWVRGQAVVKTQLEYSANLTEPNDEALRKIANNAVATLTGGPPKGTIHVKTGDIAGAQAFIDGKLAGNLSGGEGKYTVRIGDHKVVVKAPGHLGVEALITVRPETSEELALTLVPIDQGPPVNWRRVGGFAGIGAGVAFGAFGLFGSLQVNSVQQDKDFQAYQGNFTTEQDVCDEAARRGDNSIVSLCEKGSTNGILQAVMYPLAAISVGTGVYLVATSGKSPPKAGWTIAPKVSMESGKLDVIYRW